MRLKFWTTVTQIEPRDAKALIEAERAIVIDVRRPQDYQSSRIPGAIPVEEAQQRLESSDKETPIICYCYRGVSSRSLCKQLTKAGFTKVLNLQGGYAGWTKAFP